MLLMLMFQASATLVEPAAIDFDLRRVQPPERCAGGTTEIVVCGRRDAAEPYRLPTLPPGDYEPRLPTASVGVLGGTVSAHGETATMPGGATSNRAMITLKTPF
jgi:hypothetical protein